VAFETRNPTASKELLDSGQGWIYLDVRTPEEFDAGHAPGAYNVPIALRTPRGMEPNPEFVAVVKKHFDPTQQIVCGCAMGGRSARACEVLGREGYGSLVNMMGGFSGARDMSGQVVEQGWHGLGFPVVTGPCTERGYQVLKG
jgi:rhodanese-related sulfurtransferase